MLAECDSSSASVSTTLCMSAVESYCTYHVVEKAVNVSFASDAACDGFAALGESNRRFVGIYYIKKQHML